MTTQYPSAIQRPTHHLIQFRNIRWDRLKLAKWRVSTDIDRSVRYSYRCRKWGNNHQLFIAVLFGDWGHSSKFGLLYKGKTFQESLFYVFSFNQNNPHNTNNYELYNKCIKYKSIDNFYLDLLNKNCSIHKLILYLISKELWVGTRTYCIIILMCILKRINAQQELVECTHLD